MSGLEEYLSSREGRKLSRRERHAMVEEAGSRDDEQNPFVPKVIGHVVPRGPAQLNELVELGQWCMVVVDVKMTTTLTPQGKKQRYSAMVMTGNLGVRAHPSVCLLFVILTNQTRHGTGSWPHKRREQCVGYVLTCLCMTWALYVSPSAVTPNRSMSDRDAACSTHRAPRVQIARSQSTLVPTASAVAPRATAPPRVQGKGGYGIGVSKDTNTAIMKALRFAILGAINIPLYRGHTVYFPSKSKYVRTKISIFPRPLDFGITASPILNEACELIGIRDITVKVRRRLYIIVGVALGAKHTHRFVRCVRCAAGRSLWVMRSVAEPELLLVYVRLCEGGLHQCQKQHHKAVCSTPYPVSASASRGSETGP